MDEIKLLPTPRAMDGQRPRMQESGDGYGRTLGQAIKEDCVSEASSAESGCSTTGCTSPDCSTHGSASPTSGGGESFDGAGRGSLFSETSEISEPVKLLPTPNASLANYAEEPEAWRRRWKHKREERRPDGDSSLPLPVAIKEALNESTSSPAGSPARAPAAPESRKGSDIPRPFCGARWPEPSASFDPATSSWRTWRTSLLSMTEPSGERFSGTWPRSGMTLRGIAFRLEPSAPRTSVTGCSPLLPTPGAWLGRRPENAMADPERRASREHEGLRGKRSVELPDALDELKLLPTPAEGDSRNTRNSTANNGAGSTGHPGDTLSDVAWRWSGDATSPRSEGGSSFAGLRLSPWFVEWMIGAPLGWSDPDCPLSATEFKSRSDSSSAST